jgi:ribonuclease/clavin/mitogillin
MLRIQTYDPVTRIEMARTVAGRPLYRASAYLVDGLLIDSGPPSTGRELAAFARDRVVTQLVHTHGHEDHVGGDWALCDMLGLVPYAPAGTLSTLAHPPRIHLYRLIIWGQPRPVHGQPLDGRLATSHYRFQVVPTPGHTPDHVCLYEPNEGWLFSGDLFIGVHVKYLRVDEDANEILTSLRWLAGLNPATMFCAHAGIVPGPVEALQAKVAYWEEVRAQAFALYRQGRSLSAIRDAVLGPEGPMTRVTLGHYSKLNLVRSLLGDLTHPL